MFLVISRQMKGKTNKNINIKCLFNSLFILWSASWSACAFWYLLHYFSSDTTALLSNLSRKRYLFAAPRRQIQHKGRFVVGSHTLTCWYRQNNCRVPLDFAASVRTYPVMCNGEVLPGKRTSSDEVRFICAIPSKDKTWQILVEYDVHWLSI